MLQWIVVWTEKVLIDKMDDEETHVDHYQPFEDEREALNHYEMIRDMDECYIASLTAVIVSTDYDVHAKFK